MKRGDMPASSQTLATDHQGNIHSSADKSIADAGMTIRERMAMAAMASPHNLHTLPEAHKARAQWACYEADALLAELERTREGASDD